MAGRAFLTIIFSLPLTFTHANENNIGRNECIHVNPDAGFVLPYAPTSPDGQCDEKKAALPDIQVYAGSLEQCLAHMNDMYGDPGVTGRKLVGIGDNGFVQGVSLEGMKGGRVYPQHVLMTYDFREEKRKASPCVILGFPTGKSSLSASETRMLAAFTWLPLGVARSSERARRNVGAFLKGVSMTSSFGYSDRFHVGGTFYVWSPRRCPECIVQIVVGYKERPLGCLYDGKPGPFPGVKRAKQLTFPLPPGEEAYTPLDIRYKITLAYTCEEAMDMYRTSPPPVERAISSSGGHLRRIVGQEPPPLTRP